MADIDWSDPAAPRSRRFDDIYFSPQDGLAESRAVFLDGCGLPGAWADRRRFVVAELGFGTGLNIAALLHLWRRDGPPDGRLHILSVEAHPLSHRDAARALSAWPEIAEAASALLDSWPLSTPGFHRRDLNDWRVTLDLAVGDAAWALEQWRGEADAWFLDGFAPSRNPAMWSDAVLDGVRARSAPDARIGTFTVAGAVRRRLEARGFQVERRPGHGLKRERLEARLGEAVDVAPGGGRIVIVGAGVAAAAVARAVVAQGAVPVVVAPRDEAGMASALPAALVTPRFDLGDTGIAALSAQALSRAAALYDATPGAILARGVVRLEASARDTGRFDRIAAQPIWRESAVRRLSAVAASQATGLAVDRGGLWLEDARAVAPSTVRQAWLAGADRIDATVASVAPAQRGWRLIDAAGRTLVEADTVILAAGWGVNALISPESRLALVPVRGQVSLAPGLRGPAAPVVWGGYALDTPAGLMLGATHQRDDDDPAIRPGDDAANLAAASAVAPDLLAGVDTHAMQGWAGVRAVTPDRLPVCGDIGDRDGLFVLGGLGSRGFLMAPLLAEHLVAHIAGLPSPLPADLAARVDAARFSPTG